MKQHPHKDIINHWLNGGNVDWWCYDENEWMPDYGEFHREHGTVPAFSANQQFRITPKPETITYSVALFGDTDGSRWLDHGTPFWDGYSAWLGFAPQHENFICWIHLDEVFELPASK